MALKRSTIVKGSPIINEKGTASEVIPVGYLVKGVGTIAKQTSTGVVPKALALERDELGEGVDDTYQGQGTGASAYAVSDRVKVAVFKSGEQARVYVASGENIAEDDLLASAGNGLFTETATNAIARAIEASAPGAVVRPLLIEFL